MSPCLSTFLAILEGRTWPDLETIAKIDGTGCRGLAQKRIKAMIERM